jgi:hypothetical protein
MDAIFTGNLLNGEIAKWMNEKMRDYISSLFRPWRLVKAGDVSAVGAFKSSTIKALRNVIDEKKRATFSICDCPVPISRFTG